MKHVFIETLNFQKLKTLINELKGPPNGVEISGLIGPAGRGKTFGSERIFSTDKSTIYILFRENMSDAEMLRDITFRLCGVRPRFKQVCFQMIEEELSHKRRIIMVDEADRAGLSHLNVLRNLHDIFKIPILLIGENSLKNKLEMQPRLISRVREILKFDSVSQADLTVFYSQALDLKIQPKYAIKLLSHSGGDFRNVVTDAIKIERMMRASGLEFLPERLVDEICKDGHP